MVTTRENELAEAVIKALETIGDRLLFVGEKLDEMVDQLAEIRTHLEEGE